MSFKGLDFGSGIARYGDLMAQGFKDRQDLAMRQDAIDREMAQQKIRNDINTYQANALYGYGNDQFGQPGGLSGVPAFDPSVAGAGSPSQIAAANGAPANAVSQLASRNPASPYPNDPVMAPPREEVSAPSPRTQSPFENRQAKELYEKQLAAQSALQRAQVTQNGLNGRAQNRFDNSDPIQKAKVAGLVRAKAQLLAGKDIMGVPLTGAAALARDNQVSKIDQELNSISGDGEDDTVDTAPPEAPSLTKKYSASTNKTYSVDGSGKIVKIEDGHVY